PRVQRFLSHEEGALPRTVAKVAPGFGGSVIEEPAGAEAAYRAASQEPTTTSGAGVGTSPAPPAGGSALPPIGFDLADRALAMKRETMQPAGAIVRRMP